MMMNPRAEESLASLMTRHPELAPVLDRLGLDYCCGGGRTLGEAVAAAGMDFDVVVHELEQTAPAAVADDWTSLGPAALVDHLEATHHVYLAEALPRLHALATKVVAVHGERHPELLVVLRLVVDLRDELEPHLMKEERVLFPMIRELAAASRVPQFHCGTLGNPIAVMGIEHDRAGELLGALRASACNYAVPDDACASYRALYDGLAELEADTHLHIHKENNLLFPAVLALELDLAAANA